MGATLRRLEQVAFAAVLLACGALVIRAFAPGYMSYDSFHQLAQARSGEFTDWHPPLMSALWRMLDRVVPGPLGLLVLHVAMFFAGLGLLLGARFRPAVAALLTLLVAALPPVFGLLSTIWKDVGLGASLTLACGLLVWADDRRSRVALWLSLVPLAYGSAVRHEAIFATVPLALWWAAIFFELGSGAAPRRKVLAVGAALAVAFLAITPAVAALTGCKATHPIQQIFLQDLVGLSKATGSNLLPAFWQSPGAPTLEKLVAQHDPVSNIYTLQGVPLTENSADVRELGQRWLVESLKHPGAYLKLRWKMTRTQFGLSRETYYPYQSGVADLEPHVEFHPSALNDRAMRLLESTRNSILFRSVCWMVLLVAALIAVRSSRSVVAVGVSGLAYAAVHFFISTVADFRLVWWSVLASALTVLLAASELLRRRAKAKPAA